MTKFSTIKKVGEVPLPGIREGGTGRKSTKGKRKDWINRKKTPMTLTILGCSKKRKEAMDQQGGKTSQLDERSGWEGWKSRKKKRG